MRSTRATAAVARLNGRLPERHFTLSQTGAGLFTLSERGEDGDARLCEPLTLDDFVRFVDGLGPQVQRRMTKNDEAFARQLAKKPSNR
jgi:hypothetical protein